MTDSEKDKSIEKKKAKVLKTRPCSKLARIRQMNAQLLNLEETEFKLLKEIRELEELIVKTWNEAE